MFEEAQAAVGSVISALAWTVQDNLFAASITSKRTFPMDHASCRLLVRIAGRI